jgi:DNA topoisomerase-3
LKPVEIGRLDLQALAFTGRIINDKKVSDHHAIIPTGKQPGTLVTDDTITEAHMERGLGRRATRAAIIETLLGRGYIEREKKALIATDAGRYLIALVRDGGLKSAELTGEWEAKLREIERGKLDAGQFMADIVRYTGSIIRTDDDAAIDAGRLGECPRCGRPVIEGKRGFGCSGWREGCPFVLWKEYRGQPLQLAQVRELLQRRVLLRPLTFEGTGAVILQLADAGVVLEIPVPRDEPRRPAGMASQPKPGKPRRQPRGSREPSERTPGENAEIPKASPGKTAPRKSDGVLGPCPLCGAAVVEQDRSFGCSGWRDGCKFAIWKTIAGKKLSARTARTLLRKGRTPVLKGFVSKANNRFDARLKLEDGAVRFDFEP